jgi:hypothetical protein
MANLTADASLRVLGEAYTHKFVMDTSGAQTIYKGAPAVIDANVDAVHVHTAASLTLVDGDVCVGIGAEQKTVAAGDPETTLVELYTWPTILGFKSAVFTDADLGKAVYMSDTATLTASNGAYPEIGKLYKVQDGYAFVRLETPLVLDVP